MIIKLTSESSSVGRAQPCQGWGREFESRFPLQFERGSPCGLPFFVLFSLRFHPLNPRAESLLQRAGDSFSVDYSQCTDKKSWYGIWRIKRKRIQNNGLKIMQQDRPHRVRRKTGATHPNLALQRASPIDAIESRWTRETDQRIPPFGDGIRDGSGRPGVG